jgi:hypothetical protein
MFSAPADQLILPSQYQKSMHLEQIHGPDYNGAALTGQAGIQTDQAPLGRRLALTMPLSNRKTLTLHPGTGSVDVLFLREGFMEMDISTVRPRVAELAFQVLGRSVHPELFHVHKSHRIERDNYTAQIHITADGHVITWQAGKQVLTEITSSIHQPVPSSRRILSEPFRDKQDRGIVRETGIEYRYEYALERVPEEMFWMIRQQLVEYQGQHELLQVFDSSGRIAIGGLSYIHVDTRLHSLHVQAIHTFPDDRALVKTESTFAIR